MLTSICFDLGATDSGIDSNYHTKACPVIVRTTSLVFDLIMKEPSILNAQGVTVFYRELASIANHVSDRNLAVDDILQMFCMRDLANLKFVSAFFFRVEQDGRLHLDTFFGAIPDEIGLPQGPIELTSEYPFTRCIRENRLVWGNASKSSKLKLQNRFKGALAWPIVGEFKVLGSFLALTENVLQEDQEFVEWAEALATIVSGAIAKRLIGGNGDHGSVETHVNNMIQSEVLTQRQELILKLIAEGRTNNDIADILGYSESLIRQETIKIYAILGCSGRSEAANIYRRRQLEESLVLHE